MDYSVKLIDVEEESLQEITRFLRETFPKNDKFTLDFVRWQYAQNPLGKMVGFNAWDKGKIVSHFASMPISMNLFGQQKRGLVCLNVGTNDAYRGKKLFTVLGEKTIEYATESGYDFMIAVPNGNSSHAFLKYFGFYLISPLTVKVGFGKDIYSDKKFNCYKNWDEYQWKWRLHNPTNKYAYDADQRVYSPISFFAKTISQANLSDMVQEEGCLQSIGVRPLKLYVGLGADTSKGTYFDIPSFVKRPPFNLVFRDLKGDLPVIKKEDMFLQLIDLDTI